MAAAVEATTTAAMHGCSTAPTRKYQVLAAEAQVHMAERLVAQWPENFTYHSTSWNKFADGTDNILVGGFEPVNKIRGGHILFLASFHSNDATLSQLHVLIMLLESFCQSMTIVLPFYPVGTMERVVREGEVATASTLARIFNTLPSCGGPSCLIVYDLHTLQNRFYLSGNTIARLETTVPVCKAALAERASRGKPPVDCIAFPDDGAAKRFGKLFNDFADHVICGKHRVGDERIVTIMDGDPTGKHVIIIDDLVQSGGTLFECGKALKAAGAASVSAFCAHGVFPKESWRRFTTGQDRCIFEEFLVTNSIPTTVNQLPTNDVFVVLDLLPKIVSDLV